MIGSPIIRLCIARKPCSDLESDGDGKKSLETEFHLASKIPEL